MDPDGRDLKLVAGIKRQMSDRILKRITNLYRKAGGRDAIERLEKSDITFQLGTAKLETKTDLHNKTVLDKYGETKAVGFRDTLDPSDPSKFSTIDGTSGIVQVNFDFGKRDDAQTAYDNRLQSNEPASEQHVVPRDRTC